MALSPTMKRAVRRIADALGAYARNQGWWPLDFRLYFQVNEDWGHIHVIFVADGFEGRDYYESYKSVIQYLRQRLEDDPALFNAVGLVTRTSKEIEEGGIYAISPNYLFVRPRDLMKLTVREVAGLLLKYAKLHGWDDKDYRVLYRVGPGQDRVHLLFVVGGSDHRDDSQRLDSVRTFLHSRLGDEPEILNSLNLEVRGQETVGQDKVRQLIESGFKDFLAFSRT